MLSNTSPSLVIYQGASIWSLRQIDNTLQNRLLNMGFPQALTGASPTIQQAQQPSSNSRAISAYNTSNKDPKNKKNLPYNHGIKRIHQPEILHHKKLK